MIRARRDLPPLAFLQLPERADSTLDALRHHVWCRVRPVPQHRRPQHRRCGTVLIVVVVIVMLLSLAAYKYMLAMQTEHMAAAVSGDRLQAQQAALSVRDLFALMLELSRADREKMGGLRNNPLYFGGDPTVLNGTALGLSTASRAASPSNRSGEPSMQPAAMFGTIGFTLQSVEDAGPNGDTTSGTSQMLKSVGSMGQTSDLSSGPPTQYGGKNESAKLHLWTVLHLENSTPGAGVAALMQLPGMEESTAESILDWIDEDDDPRPNGAESEFYATLTRPLSPRNSLPPDLDELLFVKGVTPWLLLGVKTEQPPTTTQRPTVAPHTLNDAKETSVPWNELLTVYGAERNESYTGTPRLFVNGNNLESLHEQLLRIMPSEWADFLILFRQFGPSDENVAVESQFSESNSVTINVDTPAQHSLQTLLDLVGTTIMIPTENDDEEAQMIDSPFGSDVSAISPEVIDVFDQLTLVPDLRIVGRVNVLEAQAPVLMAIPGMNESIVEAIISDRENSSGAPAMLDTPTDSPTRQHPVWMLVEGMLDAPTMRKIWPHVTCGGDVYQAHVWGYLDERSPAVRFETILDASQGKCRPVYYRQLAAPKHEIQIKAPADVVSSAANSSRSVSDTSGGM